MFSKICRNFESRAIHVASRGKGRTKHDLEFLKRKKTKIKRDIRILSSFLRKVIKK